MIGDELRRLLAEHDAPPNEPPVDSLPRALDALAAEMMALTEAILRLDYLGAVRLQRRAERSLARAETLGSAPYRGSEDESILRALDHEPTLARLARMRNLSALVLEVAPSPSAMALAHARRGDMTAWEREAHLWITAGRPLDAPPARRRSRRETEPDRPTALREAGPAITALALAPPSDKTSS